jgi:hypothetical protein
MDTYEILDQIAQSWGKRDFDHYLVRMERLTKEEVASIVRDAIELDKSVNGPPST